MRRPLVILSALTLLGASAALAQGQAAPAQPVPQSPSPEVGTAAPEFSIPGATRYGSLAKPISLADFKGKTVVLAFFPRFRSRGCTIQMKAYRDQYSQLFHDGQDVVLIAISNDPVDSLSAWARDEQFQFLMASDTGLNVAKTYGAAGRGTAAARNVFIIGGDGKVAARFVPFREIDPTAYTELATTLATLAPAASSSGGGQ